MRRAAQRFGQQQADAPLGIGGRQKHQLFQRDCAADAHAKGAVAPRQRPPLQKQQSEHRQREQGAPGQQTGRAAVPEGEEITDAQKKQQNPERQPIQRGRDAVFAVKRAHHT